MQLKIETWPYTDAYSWEHAGSYRLVALQKLLIFLCYIKTYDKCFLPMRMTYVLSNLVLLVYKSIM